MSKDKILRKPLLKTTLPKNRVTSVDVREITFEPNQQTGRHKHPCPVIGYIAEGSAVLQIEGGTRAAITHRVRFLRTGQLHHRAV